MISITFVSNSRRVRFAIRHRIVQGFSIRKTINQYPDVVIKMMFNKLHHRTNTTPTPAGRVCRKEQGDTATANTYAYSPNSKQHAIRRIYNGLTNELYSLLWDANGNLAQQTFYSVANNATTYL